MSAFLRANPDQIHWEEPAQNKEAFLRRSNNPSVNQHMNVNVKTLNKEERNYHVIVFMKFVVYFFTLASVVPQHMLVKPNKKRRLIWDGKIKMYAYELTKNRRRLI